MTKMRKTAHEKYENPYKNKVEQENMHVQIFVKFSCENKIDSLESETTLKVKIKRWSVLRK